jgi:hypothetical protein
MMEGGIMRSQQGGGGSSFSAPAGFDSYAWAARPEAAAYSGQIIRITDVGPSAGSLFISDGTYWVPVNGSLVLDSKSNLGISTTSTTLVQLAGWSLVIPAGLFRKPGSFLRGLVKGRRTGTLGTSGFPAIKLGWSAGQQDTFCGAGVETNANDAMRGIGVLSRVSDTQVRASQGYGSYGNLGDGRSGDAHETQLRTLSATAAQTLYAYCNIATTPGSGETTWLDELIVELITP